MMSNKSKSLTLFMTFLIPVDRSSRCKSTRWSVREWPVRKTESDPKDKHPKSAFVLVFAGLYLIAYAGES